MSDVRELTPEFFYLPEFLLNADNLELGERQSVRPSPSTHTYAQAICACVPACGCTSIPSQGEPVGDVQLPPWAHGDAHEFVRKHRQALECPCVRHSTARTAATGLLCVGRGLGEEGWLGRGRVSA